MHPLLAGNPGEKRLLLGNEAIVRGALEAGVSLATTYPGTPASEIGDRLYQIAHETGLYFEYSVNEKVALECAAGAAACGLRALCAMKHVGVNVAADMLITLAYVGVRGGLILVSADDPSMFSSQNEQDNRYYARLSGLPRFGESEAIDHHFLFPCRHSWSDQCSPQPSQFSAGNPGQWHYRHDRTSAPSRGKTGPSRLWRAADRFNQDSPGPGRGCRRGRPSPAL